MARTLITADAASLYGPGPAMGQGGGAPSLEVVKGDNGRPDMADAPQAAGMALGLIDDPTFWLVATIGAAAFLAIYSETT